ncbi:MAG: hypothetical protein P4M12_04035 [Gammaproteobacteria bacterium]|nr:hypothetical protein [Gammaproteobacteria bacterium]
MHIIAIAGSTCSGSTTVTQKIISHFSHLTSVVIPLSHYLKSANHTDGFDYELLISHLIELKKGNTIALHGSKIESKQIVILDGEFALHQTLLPYIDTAIFIESELDKNLQAIAEPQKKSAHIVLENHLLIDVSLIETRIKPPLKKYYSLPRASSTFFRPEDDAAHARDALDLSNSFQCSPSPE